MFFFLKTNLFISNALLQGEITSEDKHWDSSISLLVSHLLIQNISESSRELIEEEKTMHQNRLLFILEG